MSISALDTSVITIPWLQAFVSVAAPMILPLIATFSASVKLMPLKHELILLFVSVMPLLDVITIPCASLASTDADLIPVPSTEKLSECSTLIAPLGADIVKRPSPWIEKLLHLYKLIYGSSTFLPAVNVTLSTSSPGTIVTL